MNLINKNPFRVLDLPITASDRETAKQINSLLTYAEMGKAKSFDSDFPFLTPIERTPNLIAEAQRQIEQSEGKLLYSLFWFLKNNIVDELALDILREGNIENAIRIWEKSAFNNKHKIYKQEVLFENLIAVSSHFNSLDNENHSFKNNGNEYIIRRKIDANYSVPTAFADFDYEANWIIACDTEWLAGDDNIGYGVVFGRDNSNFYTFQISGNGYWVYGKFIDWNYTKLIDWTEADFINRRGSNRISIEKIDLKLFFRINDNLVHTHLYEPFFGKNYGFKVTNIQTVSFKNFKFCKLVEDEVYGEGLDVTSKNFSNIKNLSILYLGLSVASIKDNFNLDCFRKGITLAKNIFINGNFEEYSKLIAGERYNVNSEKMIHFFISEILDSLKPYLDKMNGISSNELVSLFSTFPIEAKQVINNRFVAKQIQNIDKEIEIARAVDKTDATTITTAGRILIKNTKIDIEYIGKTLGIDNYQYQTISDKLSSAIIRCGVDAFNVCKTISGEVDIARAIKSEEGFLQAYEYAFTLAVSQRAKEKAQENLKSCKEWIENKSIFFCWFCGKNPPDLASKFEITIYQVTTRSYYPRRVQYNYVPVNIPRCRECKNIHAQVSTKFNFSLVGLSVTGLIIGIIADGYWFVGLLLGCFFGWILGTLLKESSDF